MKTYPSVLFPSKPRHEAGAIRYGESGYDFLDRMGKPGSAERREQANRMFSRYPEGPAKHALWKQIIADRPSAFEEFLFELRVHEQLLESGVVVDAIEPKVSVGRSPDFLCSLNGVRFYVEVVTVHDTPRHKRELRKLANDLCHLRKSRCSAALTVLEYSDAENQALNEVLIRKELGKAIHLNNNVETFHVDIIRPGWHLQFKIHRRPKTADYFVRETSYGAMCLDTRERLVESLREKSSRYGELAYPLVLFANIQGDGLPHLGEGLEAIFGSTSYVVAIGEDGMPDFEHGTLVRQPDGVFHLSSKTELLNSVVLFEGASCLGEAPHVRFVNPNCAAALPGLLPQCPTLKVLPASGQIVAEQFLGHELAPEHRWFHELIRP